MSPEYEALAQRIERHISITAAKVLVTGIVMGWILGLFVGSLL